MIQKYKIRTLLFMFALCAMLIALWTAGLGATSALAQTCSDGSTAKYFTSCYEAGPITDTLVAAEPAIVGYDYGTNGNGTVLATMGQVGATWGMAYQDSQSYYYSSALLKLNVDLGPEGLGGIYVTDPANPGTVVTSFDLATVCGVSVGTLSAPRDLTSGDETGIWDDVGRVGLGDIDISGDTLYVTNLADNKVYEVDITNPASPSCGASYTVPNISCADGGETHPWAVNSGDSAPGAGPYAGAVCEDGSFAQVFDLSTGNPVYPADIDMSYGGSFTGSRSNVWSPWVADQAAWDASASGGRRNYPQAIFSDIEFDPATGDMIIGFMDRSGNQAVVGYNGSVTQGMSTSGDIIHSCYVGGVYYLEGDPNCVAPNNGAGIACPGTNGNNCQWYTADGNPEDNSFAGGLAILPGSGELLFTESDPTAADSFGVGYASIMSGTVNSEYQIGSGDWGKAAAIGDIEVACAPEVVEMTTGVVTGTVQHVDGDVVPGALVTLTVGTTVYTTTTGTDGSYTFTDVMTGTGSITVDPSSIPTVDGADGDPNDKDPANLVNPSDVTITAGETTAAEPATVPEVETEPTTGVVTGTVQHVDGDVVPGALVTLTVGTTVYTTTTGTDGSYTFTGVMTGTGSITVDPSSIPSADGADGDMNDKDPANLVNPADVTITAGETTAAEPATVPEVAPEAVLGEIGDMVTNATSGAGLDGVTVELYVGTTATGTPTQTATTMNGGMYSFANLPLGDYTVAILTSTLPATKDASGLSDITVSLTDQMTSTDTADFAVPDDVPAGTPGQLTVIKAVEGANLPNPLPAFDITVGGTAVTVAPGTPYVMTDIVSGTVINVNEPSLPSTDWAMGIMCAGAAAADQNTAGGVDVTVADGQSVTCTITNTYTEPATAVPTDTPMPQSGSVSGIVRHVDGDLVSGATVYLTDSSGAIVGTTQTQADGSYSFTNVSAGNYTVVVDPSSITAPDGSDGDGNAKDPSSLMNPASVTVTEGMNTAADDATVAESTPVPTDTPMPTEVPPTPAPETGNVTGNISHVDGDPVAGATVELRDADGMLIATTTTNQLGNYVFIDVAPGSGYTAQVVESTVTLPGDGDGNDKDLTNLAPVSVPEVVDGGISQAPVIDIPEEIPTEATQTPAPPSVIPGSVTGNISHVDGDPVSGATVNLLDAMGNVVGTTQTDAAGNYQFTDITPGSGYTAVVDPTTVTAPDDADSDANSKDTSGIDPVSVPPVMSGEISQAPVIDVPEMMPSLDIIKTASSGTAAVGEVVTYTYVVVNTGNVPLDDVTVVDDVLGAVTLDLGGTTLGTAGGIDTATGTIAYTVQEGDVGNMPNTATATGTAPDGTEVMDEDTILVVVTDQPDAPLGSIGDMITNEDSGDPLQGVTVMLYDADDMLLATATTNAAGMYMFDNLLAGDYTVTVDTATLPASKVADGAVTSIDVTLGEDEDNTTTDFMYPSAPLGSIGDMITNLDSGDPLAGVIVKLTMADGSEMFEVTNAMGQYLFADLAGGMYTVEVLTPSLPEGKTAEGVTSTSTVDLAPGENNLDQDFAYPSIDDAVLGSIGDTIYNDNDGDGMQDAGEPGLAGVTVLLTGPGGMQMTAETDANGSYSFTGLEMGDYTVTVDPSSLPAQKQGAANTGDPDGGLANVSTVTLSEGGVTDNPDQDFGYLLDSEPLGSIGNVIYHDLNNNGTQDAGEPGLSGVEVVLTLPNGTTVSQLTGSDGSYLFSNLELGSYDVTVNQGTLPMEKQGASNTEDPDGGTSGTSTTVLSEAGQINDTDENFGFFNSETVLGSISRTIFHDLNGNGVQDAGEPGLSGVSVTLTRPDGTTATTTTDVNGNYTFENLPSGDYDVTVDPTTLPGGKKLAFNTADPDGGANSTSTIGIDGNDDVDQNFGYQAPAIFGSIGNTIFHIDGTPLEDVIVELLQPDGTTITTTTNAEGVYLFDNLPLGEYTVTVDVSTVPEDKQEGAPAYSPDNGNDDSSTLFLSVAQPDNELQDFVYGKPTAVTLTNNVAQTSWLPVLISVLVVMAGATVVARRFDA